VNSATSAIFSESVSTERESPLRFLAIKVPEERAIYWAFFSESKLVEAPYHLREIEEDISGLQEIYIFHEPENVKAFLRMHEELIPVLFKAPEHINRIFGQNPPLYLELLEDPEDNEECLFLIIGTNRNPKEAVELLERLYEKWERNLPFGIRSIFAITV
jgi:hypothetical protein